MSEWPTVRLGEVVGINPDTVPADERFGRLRYVDIAAVSESFGGIRADKVAELDWEEAPSRARRRIREGDILVSTVRPYLRGFGVVGPELDGAVGSTGFAVIRPSESAPSQYLWSLVRSQPFVRYLVSRQTGANYPAVRADDIGEFEFPLPPVDEQAPIAALFGSLDELAVAHRQGELASRRLLRDLREALLGATVERVKLGEILLTIEGGRSPLAEDRPPGEGERAVLKVSAVRPDRFVPKESKTLAEETEMPERARVRRGDVLITRANTAALVGAVCQVDADHAQLFLSDKTLRLTLDDERVDDRYLIHALTTRAARQQIARLATGTSASMKNISQQKLKLVELPLSGLDQQRFAVATLDAVSTVMREHANTLAAVESLRRQVTDAVLRQEFLPGEVMAGGELAPAAI